MEEMVKSGYLIREQIGQGAFGVIYHALDEKNHREAAIKVWKAGSETEIFSYENSPFLREERIPGIVKIYDYLHRLGGPNGKIRQSEFFLYSKKTEMPFINV